jgi:hypothetical protein
VLRIGNTRLVLAAQVRHFVVAGLDVSPRGEACEIESLGVRASERVDRSGHISNKLLLWAARIHYVVCTL